MDADVFDAILETIHRFVRTEVVAAEEAIEEGDRIPDDLRRKAADMGLFGYALPEEHGGLGLDMLQEARVALEFGWTTPAFRSMLGTNNGIAGQVLVHQGTPEQQAEYLPRMATGELISSFALTEPEAGSDVSALRTRAVRDGEDYVLDGQKRFITNALDADVLMVFARTDQHAPAHQGISAFIVPTNTPGVTVGPKDTKMGQRGTTTSEIFFDGARIPAGNLVGGVEGQGFTAAMRSLAKGRLHIAAMCVGLAQRLTHESLTYAMNAGQGGTRIAEFQLVQAMLADNETETYAGRTLVLDAARAYVEGNDQRMGPSCAKLFCSEMVGRVADRAVQIHGGMGYMNDVPVSRFYRDARLFRLYEGTSEIQRLIIARQMIRSAG